MQGGERGGREREGGERERGEEGKLIHPEVPGILQHPLPYIAFFAASTLTGGYGFIRAELSQTYGLYWLFCQFITSM